ncbi:hypothetical protein D6D29_07325 [Aureobasidium pullulans]|nr:hypothetical protein D6D29_07325 [Aureobasidium pullulans]
MSINGAIKHFKMLNKALAFSALAALAAAAPRPQLINLDEIPDYTPTVTMVPGLTAQVVTYDPTAAISAAAADVTDSPLLQEKRDLLQARAACAAQPTMANVYNIDVSSASAFRADTIAAGKANNAVTPSGYALNFQNSGKASSAYGYLGYQTVPSYDPSICANKCNSITGCLAFNIYFERDPTVEPGTGCTNPSAFANIKCSYWGGNLDTTTLTNGGQMRSSFEVAIAGSNGYTTTKYQVISGYTTPKFLNTAVMNAPTDCNGADTYMGYKLFNEAVFDARLCSAACDAQSAYNIANPPSDGSKPKLCKFFNTYILNKNGVGQGQYCSMYTEQWSSTYATNTGQNRGSDKYTMSFSFMYGNTTDDGTPACASTDSAFCSAYINYIPPVSTIVSSFTPAPTTVTSTQVNVVTSTIYTATITAAAGHAARVRRDGNGTETGLDYSISIIESIDPSYTNKPVDIPQTASSTGLARRALATPAKFANWPASRISASCSIIATGRATTTVVSTASAPQTTVAVTSASTTTVYGTLTVPGVQLASPTAIIGSLSGSPGSYDDLYYHLDLPFPIGAFGKTSSSIWLEINGCVSLNTGFGTYSNTVLPNTVIADTTLLGYWDDLYIYQGTQQGIYYDITGEVGSRVLQFEFYTSAFQRRTEYFHFIMTFYENQVGLVKYKYFDISYNGLSATVGAQSRSAGKFLQYSFNQAVINPGLEITIDTNAGTMTHTG